jgi:hypothetical protein
VPLGATCITLVQNPRNLREMIQVVPGVQAQQVSDGFLSAFCMDTVAIQTRLAPLTDECEPGLTKWTEQCEGGGRLLVLIVERGRPGVLVERLDRHSGRRQNHADSVRRHDLRVRQMRDDRAGRPS